MTLLTVPWPLPKASVEYAWVQPHKLLLSALKSVGSPAQQMGGDQKENLVKEKERRTCLTYLQWWEIKPRFPLFMLPLRRERQEALARAAMLVRTPRACMHPIVCAWMWECSDVCLQVLLWVSVHIILPEALDSCQATVAGSSALGRAEQTLPHAYGFDKRRRSARIRYQVRVAAG